MNIEREAQAITNTVRDFVYYFGTVDHPKLEEWIAETLETAQHVEVEWLHAGPSGYTWRARWNGSSGAGYADSFEDAWRSANRWLSRQLSQ